MGMGGTLDSGRFRTFVAKELGVSIKIGKSGVEQIYKMSFNEDERKLWDVTVGHVKESVDKVNAYLRI